MGRFWPAATADGATINGRDTAHCGRRCLERPLYDAPLPLVANNWSALDNPLRSYTWLISAPETCP
jgi:hypothetical protein